MKVKNCKMNKLIRISLYALPCIMTALFCGCGESVEPADPVTNMQLTSEVTSLTTTATTTETTTTTTTTDAYTPPADPELVSIVENMTVRQKAAQMMMVGCVDENAGHAVCEEGAGALCLFAQPFEYKSAEQVQMMTDGFQSAAAIPMLLSVDEEGGTVNRVSLNQNLRPNIFFSPLYLYQMGGMDLICSDTAEKADFLLNLGLNSNLAPVCDVPLSEWDFIYKRSFGTDADATAEYIRTVVGIMKEHKIGTTLKHFPGYGGSSDTHLNMAYDGRSYEEFDQRDLKPFRAGIAAGADSVMVTHNIVECMDSEKPASLSKEVHRVLREELGFRGVIITDDLGMNAITQFTNGQNPAVAAVLAGNDMLCYAEFGSSVDAITQAVESGLIEESQLDASVLRILYWKQTLGLL